MTPPPLPPDLFDSLPSAVQSYIRALEALAGRVAALEARLGRNSSNTSKPPSSDGPHVKPAPPKTPSGKRRDGQPGHPRQERVILPPDQVFDHKPARCRRCAARLTGDDPHPTVDQVFDLPEQLRHVVHHRRHTLACPCCHARTTAPTVPEAASRFGPKLTATVAYLSGVGRLGKRTIRTLLDDPYDLPVSIVRGWIRDGLLAHYRLGTKGRRGKIAIAAEDSVPCVRGGRPLDRPAPPESTSALVLKHLHLS